MYNQQKIPDARTYFTPRSSNEDSTLSFDIPHLL